MSRSVELPDPVYAALEAAASASGTTPAAWIAAQFPSTTDAPPRPESACDETLGDAWSDYIGLFNSGGSNPSSGYDEMFRDTGEEHEPHAVGASRRVIAISEEVYQHLEEQALAFGTTPEEWIAARLPRHSSASGAGHDQQPVRTLAERFEGYLGLVSLDRTDLGARASELFAEGMEEKHRDGRL